MGEHAGSERKTSLRGHRLDGSDRMAMSSIKGKVGESPASDKGLDAPDASILADTAGRTSCARHRGGLEDPRVLSGSSLIMAISLFWIALVTQ